jgi:hypothetical protein
VPFETYKADRIRGETVTRRLLAALGRIEGRSLIRLQKSCGILEEIAKAIRNDTDGSAIVIHQTVDNYTSDPAGNAGDRVACGVITRWFTSASGPIGKWM